MKLRRSLSSILRAGVIVVSASVLMFCYIESVTGPTVVALGATADFVVEFGFGNSNADMVFLAMDVPVGWTVASCEYEGNGHNGPFEGEGIVWDEYPGWCESDWGQPPVGYERLLFVAYGDFGPGGINDWAFARVRFNVDGGTGDYDLAFGSGGLGFDLDCNGPVNFPVFVSHLLMYDDYFESGDTSRWSASVP